MRPDSVGARLFDPAATSRRLAIVERGLGYIVSGFGILCFIMWWTGRAQDRHGMFYAFIVGSFILPMGALLVLGGYTIRQRTWWRWPIQILIVAWPWIFWPLFHWIM